MLVYAERNSRSIQKLLQEKTKDITMEEEGAEGKLGWRGYKKDSWLFLNVFFSFEPWGIVSIQKIQ